MYLQHMLLGKRQLFGHLQLLSTMYIVFAPFKPSSLSIRIKIPVAILQIVYICMTAISLNLSS